MNEGLATRFGCGAPNARMWVLLASRTFVTKVASRRSALKLAIPQAAQERLDSFSGNCRSAKRPHIGHLSADEQFP